VDLLGKAPDWYKSRSYRARAVFEPRAVLRDFGFLLPAAVAVRVHDSTADCRYLVLPMQPTEGEGAGAGAGAGTGAGAGELQQLAALVTRDSMVGVTDIVAAVAVAEKGGEA
jgi:nitrile hydratase